MYPMKMQRNLRIASVASLITLSGACDSPEHSILPPTDRLDVVMFVGDTYADNFGPPEAIVTSVVINPPPPELAHASIMGNLVSITCIKVGKGYVLVTWDEPKHKHGFVTKTQRFPLRCNHPQGKGK
jgi:hypothetical protein